MKTREIAGNVISNSDSYIRQGKNLIQEVKNLVANIIDSNLNIILLLEDEGDCLSMLAIIGDQMYKGNVFTESVDGLIISTILKQVDRFLLDNVFGKNWFEKLQSYARKRIEASQ